MSPFTENLPISEIFGEEELKSVFKQQSGELYKHVGEMLTVEVIENIAEEIAVAGVGDNPMEMMLQLAFMLDDLVNKDATSKNPAGRIHTDAKISQEHDDLVSGRSRYSSVRSAQDRIRRDQYSAVENFSETVTVRDWMRMGVALAAAKISATRYIGTRTETTLAIDNPNFKFGSALTRPGVKEQFNPKDNET